jgi:hypothetical protein
MGEGEGEGESGGMTNLSCPKPTLHSFVSWTCLSQAVRSAATFCAAVASEKNVYGCDDNISNVETMRESNDSLS